MPGGGLCCPALFQRRSKKQLRQAQHHNGEAKHHTETHDPSSSGNTAALAHSDSASAKVLPIVGKSEPGPDQQRLAASVDEAQASNDPGFVTARDLSVAAPEASGAVLSAEDSFDSSTYHDAEASFTSGTADTAGSTSMNNTDDSHSHSRGPGGFLRSLRQLSFDAREREQYKVDPGGSLDRERRHTVTGDHNVQPHVAGSDDGAHGDRSHASFRDWLKAISLPKSKRQLQTIHSEQPVLPLRLVPGSTLAGASITGHAVEVTEPFDVRGPKYFKDKKKQPSEQPVYQLLAADALKSPSKLYHITQHFELAQPSPMVARNPAGLPPYLVVNVQLPDYSPPLWAGEDADGPSIQLVFFFALRAEFVAKPTDATLKLLQRFVQDHQEPHTRGLFGGGVDKFRERLKLLARIANPPEVEMSAAERKLVTSYNGKPVLTRPQHTFHQGDTYLEVDLDVHRFNYLARRGLETFKTRFEQMVLDIGFVLQGNAHDELPEQLLACVRLSKLGHGQVRSLEDVLHASHHAAE
eukprot:jgi/Chlat1/1841/Chrsp14S08698